MRSIFGAVLAAATVAVSGASVASDGSTRSSVMAPAPTNPLWKDGKVRNYLPYMTWREVEALLKKTDFVIIPVGAIEQHGIGGPLGTDYLNGTERALLVAQQTDALVAPILLPGQSPYHMDFPGTITLSSETIERVYFEAAQSLIRHGFRRFLFLNSHGGNAATTAFIVDRINQGTSAVAVELNEAAATMATPPSTGAGKKASPEAFDQHGGVNETSNTLYLLPGLYDKSGSRSAKLTYPPQLQAMIPDVLAGNKAAGLIFMAQALKQRSTGKHTAARDMSDTGAWSELNPADATAARGRDATDRFVTNAVAFINTWKRLQPHGVD